ncbi:hypothetical protein NC653_013013 [Populus alba x Populus x berolinensis]|uniref:Uncharacterized protein n=1 Tax=Populus alba x Populus x berolinensis TaxID=444605 RepID=A0AAD6QTD2_9ROSI|nr:hypothetical protein NC653_013013 [Populus alba x Populus x berolinensis]
MLSLTCPPMYLSISFPPERAAGFWVYCNDRFQRGVKRKPMASIKKLREAVSLWSTQFLGGLEQKGEAPDGEKPEPLRTHLRNMIIVPEMIGHYLAEFSMARYAWKTWTHTSRFIPL